MRRHVLGNAAALALPADAPGMPEARAPEHEAPLRNAGIAVPALPQRTRARLARHQHALKLLVPAARAVERALFQKRAEESPRLAVEILFGYKTDEMLRTRVESRITSALRGREDLARHARSSSRRSKQPSVFLEKTVHG
jgi:hypothetical protein